MVPSRTIRLAVTLSVIGLAFPQLPAYAFTLTTATQEAQPASQIRDVELGEGGLLTGNLIQGNTGQAMTATRVVLRSTQSAGDDKSTDTVTNDNGGFEFQGLQGGVYVLTSGDNSGVVRLWTQGAAPPNASQQVLMVSGPIHRGHLVHWFRNMSRLGKVFVIGGIATAIAVPIAVAADDDDSYFFQTQSLPPASP
jgi:hypothetical protein